MNIFIIGFCTLLISAILWTSIPSVNSLPWIAVFAWLAFKKSKLLSGALLAVFFISLFVFRLFSVLDDLKNENEFNNGSALVRGEIVSFFGKQGEWASADIRILRPNSWLYPSSYLRLSWSDSPSLSRGQIWDFSLRLKPITSVLNQGGFNQQKYFLSKHIIAKGKVLKAKYVGQTLSLRNRMIESLLPIMTMVNGGDIFQALLLGDKQLITAERWQSLRETGTGHLVAISGLHLSVISIWSYFVSLVLLKQFHPTQTRSNLIIALCFSLFTAFSYAYLAGFSLATQRALVMIMMVFVLSLLKRHAAAWERLLYALFAVLLWDPLSFLSAGFWLSFSALGIIIFSANNLINEKQKFKAFVVLQFKLTLGLGIVQTLLFGGVGLYSFWINLLMVPWFSFVVIPISLMLFLCWGVAFIFSSDWSVVFFAFEWLILPFDMLLDLVKNDAGGWITFGGKGQALLLMLILAIVIYRFFPYKAWRALLILPVFPFVFWLYDFNGERWQLHLLDVGQGLAVVIEKNGRGIVYDTGAAFGNNFSYAERVIIPFLTYRHIQKIDYIFISHIDNDHAGGALMLKNKYVNSVMITDAFVGSQPCRPQIIQWQQLTIQILSPKRPSSGNNGSCVVKVFDDKYSVLLTGDIEKETEESLLKKYSQAKPSILKSNVVIAPHHGSRTSSLQEFIEAVKPELTLFAAGYGNHYGFPKPDVVSRYQKRGSKILTSGDTGQISVTFDEQMWRIRTYRGNLSPFWYNQIFELTLPDS